jgi:hypothetical protein
MSKQILKWHTDLPRPHVAVLIKTDYSACSGILIAWRSRGKWWTSEHSIWVGKVFGWIGFDEIDKVIEI